MTAAALEEGPAPPLSTCLVTGGAHGMAWEVASMDRRFPRSAPRVVGKRLATRTTESDHSHFVSFFVADAKDTHWAQLITAAVLGVDREGTSTGNRAMPKRHAWCVRG
jgi:hypothetical protein